MKNKIFGGPKIKRFDPEAITERELAVLQKKSKWKNVQVGGAVHQLIETHAESNAEIARYGEYLLQELKWDTSRNFPSTKHMAKLVSKKLNRKHSAVGTIIVSHSDLEGNTRFSNIGKSIVNIDTESNYDDGELINLDDSLVDDANTFKSALVPWIPTTKYSVPVGAIFTANNGTEFVCAKHCTIKTWEQKWSRIYNKASLYNSFRASGGWEGYKYLVVPIVQGVQKTTYLGNSDNTAAQSFMLGTVDIEAADSYYTSQFCWVEVEGDNEHWEEIQHLGVATATDKVFEINITDDLSGTEIKFGDGVNGAIPPDSAKITLHYLETRGEAGNINDLYSFKYSITIPKTVDFENPTIPEFSSNNIPFAIGCQNVWPIIGGKDLETLSEFKANAETAYSKNYKILHTISELNDNLNLVSPIPLIKTIIKTFYEKTMLNDVAMYRNVIGVTGLSTALNPLTPTEISLFNKISNLVINDKVLSNKIIKYVSPNIVEIDSAIEVELHNSIISPERFESDLAAHLYSEVGKPNTNTIDAYNQSELIKRSLQFSDNIASIWNTSLLTVNSTELLSIEIGDKDYFGFKFEFPKLKLDVTGKDGLCCKNSKDGNQVVGVYNLSIAGNKVTYVITDDVSNNKTALSGDSVKSNMGSTQMYKVWGATSSSNRYTLAETLKEKHTFTRADLQDFSSNLKGSFGLFTTPYYYFNPTSQGCEAYLFIPAEEVVALLGYKGNMKSTGWETIRAKAYASLQSAIDYRTCNASFSIEPADFTVTSDWDTVMYYNNITATILQ